VSKSLRNKLADKVDSLVRVIMGVICVLAFRRWLVGEGIKLYRRMIGENESRR